MSQDGAVFRVYRVSARAPAAPVLRRRNPGRGHDSSASSDLPHLRYRGGGRVGLVASAGVSYLPGLDFAVTQELGIGAVGGVGGIDLPTLPLEAGGEIAGFWGANAGLGLRVRLSDAVSASVEGRAFFFGERELEWTIERFPISPDLGELRASSSARSASRRGLPGDGGPLGAFLALRLAAGRHTVAGTG